MRRVAFALPGAFALALIIPAAAPAGSVVMAGACGDPSLPAVPIPVGPSMPDNHACCKGACHSGHERKQLRRAGVPGGGDGPEPV